MGRLVVSFGIVSIAATLWIGAVPALEVPVVVQELLPQGVPGQPRAPDVVTVGVPLAPDDDIRSIDQLGFSGTSAAQFRVLQRDPETGLIRWLQASFLAESLQGPYALTRGDGSFGGADLAFEQDSLIVVSTGAARFEIRKSGFNLLDRVEREGAVLMASGSSGLVVMDGGIRYASALDRDSETVIEENGPVKAVVRSRGVLRSSTGERHLGYTVRLQFARGQSTCRAFVSLRNGELASLSPRTFDAAWVELPVQLTGDRNVSFGLPGNDLTATLAPTQSAHLFQGDNIFMRNGRTVRILPDLTPAEGLEVVIDGATYKGLGTTSEFAEGWIRVQDASHAVLAGMRDFAALFPGGLDFRDNTIAIELFSRHNPQTGLVFSWGAHETRELLFDFAGAAGDPLAFLYQLQYPLLGRCSFEHYRKTGAIFGQQRLVTVEEEQKFFEGLDKSWSLENYSESDLELMRQFSFSTTGGGNQFDQDLTQLIDFLRTGYAGRFLQARLGVLWKADQAVFHSDDFDYGERQNGVSDVDVSKPSSFNGKGAGNTFDDEHPHWVCMPLYYYLSGDERVREAMIDYGEWRRYRAGNPFYGPINGGGLNHFRFWSRAFRDLALMYEITHEERYLEDVRRMAGWLTSTLEQDGSRGRNLERGYFYFGDPENVNRRIHLFYLTDINPICAVEAMRVLPSADPLREELRDYLTGVAYFTLREAQITPTASGYPYGYYADVPNTETGNRGDQTGIVLTHGYETSGNLEFIERARDLTWRVLVDQHELRGSELSTHARIYRWLHRNEVSAVFIAPEVERNADGSYTLRWEAPARASEYIVKYGARPLVENLDFDQLARTYRVDPEQAMNFWAAQNLADEPEPGPVETQEAMTTPVLPEGPWHFRVKAILSGPPNAAPTTQSDAVETEEDQAIRIDVLGNDSDTDGALDPASVSVEVPAANGSTDVDPSTGSILYTPAPDWSGSDTFGYRVRDDVGEGSEITPVTVMVHAVNDAPMAVPDSVVVEEDHSAVIDVLGNDSDLDGSVDPTSVVIVEAASKGSLQLDAGDGSILYQPNDDYFGIDTFEYKVADDGGGMSGPTRVTIDVLPVNDHPSARADSVEIIEDHPVTIPVLANDSDVDGSIEPASLLLTVPASNGSTSIDPQAGVVTYAPAADYSGADRFFYVVSDDQGAESQPAEVVIMVLPANDPPVALPDSVVAMEDGTIAIDVLANDSDVEGELLPGSVVVLEVPTHGAASVDGKTGRILYTPEADFHGSDHFIYSVQDGAGSRSDSTRVVISVQPINDAPVAIDDQAEAHPGAATTIAVLRNDLDVDGDPLQVVSMILDDSHGSASIDPGDSTITYTAPFDLAGGDRIQYVVSDGMGGSATASVSLHLLSTAALAGDLEARIIPDGVEVAWVVYEGDSLRFDVLRSTNREEFETIATDLRQASPGPMRHQDLLPAMQPGSRLLYRLQVALEDGPRQFIAGMAELVYIPMMPQAYALAQNIPNPFNPRTKIPFELPRGGFTTLRVYDAFGRIVRTLLSGDLQAGFHSETWDGRDRYGRRVSSGVYYYVLRSERFASTRKMLLLK